MEPISPKRKIALFSFIVLAGILAGIFVSGKIPFSFLQSNVLQSCTEESQKAKFPQYQKFIQQRQASNTAIQNMSGEISVARKRITDTQNIIQQKQKQIATLSDQIKEINAFLEKNCKPGSRNPAICQTKRQQLKNLTQDREIVKNSVAISQNTILQLKNRIGDLQTRISQQNQIITRLNKFIYQYESCRSQLQNTPVLTSPQMSGEVMISGETLVSGEVKLIGKTFISGEVMMSGEPCVSGEVRVPVYRLSISSPYTMRTDVHSINFSLGFGNPDTIKIDDIFITEESQSIPLFSCSFLDQNWTQLHCTPTAYLDDRTGSIQGTTKNYILSAKVNTNNSGSLKVYNANIVYNGGRTDAINQTTTVMVNYDTINSCSQPIKICPAVCIPLYEVNNTCKLNSCGSGCGADNIKTFTTLAACQKAQQNTVERGKYTAYMDGRVLLTTDDITEQDARENCASNVANNPQTNIRCVWEKLLYAQL